MMKKILTSVLAASLMLLGTSAFAQVSVNVGYANSKLTYSNSNKSKAPANGFYAGLEYNVPVGDIFGLSVGANYEMLMSKDYKLGNLLSGNFKEMYLNAPVRLNFGYEIADGIRLFVFGGPTFSYALSGKIDSNIDLGILTVGGQSDVYKDLNWNRFDVMVGGGGGIELMDKIRLTVGYDQGMFNKLPKGSDGKEASNKLTRSQLTAGVAFIF